MAGKDKAARRKYREQKRGRKHREQKQDRRWSETRQHELSLLPDPEDENFSLLRVLYQDGGRTPSVDYEGQEAMDRMRRWCVGMMVGRTRVDPGAIDKAWVEAPAHGPVQGTWWKQHSGGRGCVVTARIPRMMTWSGLALSDKEATNRLAKLQADWFVDLDTLSPEEIVKKLSAVKDGELVLPVFASGWSFMFSFDATSKLNMLSCQARPMGLPVRPEQIIILDSVTRLVGVPSERECVVWADPGSIQPDQLAKWCWKDLQN